MKEMSEDERSDKIDEISEGIIAEATDGTHYDASVESFFHGNEYYLFVYENLSRCTPGRCTTRVHW